MNKWILEHVNLYGECNNVSYCKSKYGVKCYPCFQVVAL